MTKKFSVTPDQCDDQYHQVKAKNTYHVRLITCREEVGEGTFYMHLFSAERSQNQRVLRLYQQDHLTLLQLYLRAEIVFDLQILRNDEILLKRTHSLSAGELLVMACG